MGVLGEASTDIPRGLHEIRLATLGHYSGTCHYNILKLNINSYASSFFLLLASYCFQT